MSDLQALLLVLAVVYCWECLAWLRRGTVAFLAGWGNRWRLVHPAALVGNQSGGLVLAWPLPPLGTFHTASQWPLSISADGVYSYVAQCVNPGWRPAQPGKYFQFEAIQKIEAPGKEVRVNGELFLRTDSPFVARRVAALLRQAAKLSANERARAIQKLLRESLDVPAVRERLKDFNRRASTLRNIANFLFAYLFLIAPACVWYFGFRRSWLELLVGLLLLTTTAAVLFHRAHKALYPEADEERFTHSILILLSPATAVRARDALSRPLLEAFHPLAVARALLPAERFNEFARKILLEIRHPCLPVCPATEPGPRLTEDRSRAALREVVEQFLQSNGINPADLLKPPRPADESCRSFCPRCQAQFVAAEGVCADCGGLPLNAFTEQTH
jgi:hypothetical protein